jgi:hypothetical protein
VLSKTLKVGDLLKNRTGEWQPIRSIEKVAETLATYNFEVAKNHDYFVGQNGWLVHNQSLWTSTKSKSSVENAFSHWEKHKSEFPEFLNSKQYVEGAKNFLNNPPTGALTKTQGGNTLIYETATNTFGVRTANGTPRTLFRPDPSKHGFPTNLDFFLSK